MILDNDKTKKALQCSAFFFGRFERIFSEGEHDQMLQ